MTATRLHYVYDYTDVDKAFWREHLESWMPACICDAHVHLSRPDLRLAPMTDAMRRQYWVSEVNEPMDAATFDRCNAIVFPGRQVTALAFGHPSLAYDVDAANEYVRRECMARAWPCLSELVPQWSVERAAAELAKPGVIGFKPYYAMISHDPATRDKHLEASIFEFMPHPLLELLDQRRAWLTLHPPKADRLGHPDNLREVKEIRRRYPNIVLVIAHLGRSYTEPHALEALPALADDPELYFDISAVLNPAVLRLALELFGPERLLYGTDNPVFYMRGRRQWDGHRYINRTSYPFHFNTEREPPEVEATYTLYVYEALRALRDVCEELGVKRDGVEAILHGNAQRLLESVMDAKRARGEQAPAAGAATPCRALLGDSAVDAMARARDFLRRRSQAELLGRVGQVADELAWREPTSDKRAFPESYGGGKPCHDDLLAGDGLFYVNQAGKVMLDCTAGHYQMTWGYNHPSLMAAARDGMDHGVVWDNHSNTPSPPVKALAERLVSLGAESGLDRVLLGVATGSVACSTAVKVMLARYFADSTRTALGKPVIVTIEGNYHGTDMVVQSLRGMWPGLVGGLESVNVEPNDPGSLEAAFEQYGRRVAGFWAEPILMNREAIEVEPAYLQLARRLCTEHDALMAIDEIQTGFWYPGVLLFRQLGIDPDFVIVGKGMTAGFHPLSGVLYRRELDILEQYDSISTNGNASLAALVALCNIGLIERSAERLAALADRHYEGLRRIAAALPDRVERINGRGLLLGMKLRDRDDALGLHKAAVERGLWLRAHAYHPGHRTILTKFALSVDEAAIDHVHAVLTDLLTTTPWRA